MGMARAGNGGWLSCLDCFCWCRVALGHELALPHSIGVCDGLIRVIDSGSKRESCFSPKKDGGFLLPAVLWETLQADNMRLLFCEAEVLQGVYCEGLFCIYSHADTLLHRTCLSLLQYSRVCFFFRRNINLFGGLKSQIRLDQGHQNKASFF